MAIAKVQMGDVGEVIFEVDDRDYGVARVRRGDDGVLVATDTVEASLGRIQQLGQTVLDAMTKLAPEKVTIEFGVKLSAAAGAIIARTEAEGHFAVTLEWQPKPTPAALPHTNPTDPASAS